MSLRQRWRTVRIVYLALMISVGMYGVILFVLSQQPSFKTTPPPTFSPYMLIGVLAGVGLMQLGVFVPMLHKKLMPPRQRDGSDRVDFDDKATEELATPLINKMRVGLIVTWAFCEAVAVYGFLCAFLFKEMIYFVPFAAVSLAAFLYHAPTDTMLASFVRAERNRIT